MFFVINCDVARELLKGNVLVLSREGNDSVCMRMRRENFQGEKSKMKKEHRQCHSLRNEEKKSCFGGKGGKSDGVYLK